MNFISSVLFCFTGREVGVLYLLSCIRNGVKCVKFGGTSSFDERIETYHREFKDNKLLKLIEVKDCKEAERLLIENVTKFHTPIDNTGEWFLMPENTAMAFYG